MKNKDYKGEYISMRKLNTIQKVENLNNVFADDNSDLVGSAAHHYAVKRLGAYEYRDIACIDFQCGARNDIHSKEGVLDTDLLEIVRDRLKGFQSGEFATDDNEKALEHIEIALMYMNKRVMDRYERNVLGTYEE